ncbi:MAG: hypothetical protein DRO00_01115 [Thermoproteota archaeon]|nr:MAG: hypothetical protein DRO00_01115 [Candidatus Korarchaeota archaeon]
MSILKRFFRKKARDLEHLNLTKQEVEEAIREIQYFLESLKTVWERLEKLRNKTIGKIMDPPYSRIKESVEELEDFLELFKKLVMCTDCEFLRFQKRIIHGWMLYLEPICIYGLEEWEKPRDANLLAFKDEIEGIWGCPLGRWKEIE